MKHMKDTRAINDEMVQFWVNYYALIEPLNYENDSATTYRLSAFIES